MNEYKFTYEDGSRATVVADTLGHALESVLILNPLEPIIGQLTQRSIEVVPVV